MNRPSALPGRHILSRGVGFYFTWLIPNFLSPSRGRGEAAQKKPGKQLQPEWREGQEDLSPGENEEEWK